MADSLILDYWNGRPSAWMSSTSGDPFLHWMILGHNEDFELWLHARLTWPVADQLATAPPRLLDDALRLIGGAPVRFVLEDAGRPVVIADVELPKRDATLTQALQPMVDAMQTQLQGRGLDGLLIKAAQRDLEQLLVA